ncbi:pyridoxal 5'-phosphate synthase glutaminase subunit PdxT [Salinibacterium hongtaonis]|nr:pyridoxal 5'-phosphate synthase glutaminase subunit PdxT [Salinibacterium hongtaonis]
MTQRSLPKRRAAWGRPWSASTSQTSPLRTASQNVAGNPTVPAAPRVGVLALQGDFREHRQVLESLGADTVAVRRETDLAGIDGLVIPGGESTVIDKLSRAFGVADPIKAAISGGLPVYGTCAGLIMVADRILDGAATQQSFGGLDVSVRRNAFGSQTESFETALAIPVLGEHPMRAVFIRAPIVVETGPGVSVLASLVDGTIVAVEQANIIATSFHPEVTDDYRLHRYFLDRVRQRMLAR